MQIISCTLIFVLFSIGTTLFPKEDILKLLKSDDKLFSYEVDSIPDPILKVMSEIAREEIIISEPFAEFNDSDAIDNENLPFRRLIFTVHSEQEKHWIIYYEKGGRSHNSYLVYVTLNIDDEVSSIYIFAPDTNNDIIRRGKDLSKKLKDEEFIIIYNNGKPLKRNYLGF